MEKTPQGTSEKGRNRIERGAKQGKNKKTSKKKRIINFHDRRQGGERL